MVQTTKTTKTSKKRCSSLLSSSSCAFLLLFLLLFLCLSFNLFDDESDDAQIALRRREEEREEDDDAGGFTTTISSTNGIGDASVRREKACGNAPKAFLPDDLAVFFDASFSNEEEEEEEETSKNVLEHESGTGIDAFSRRQRRRGNDGGATKTSSSSCSSIFVSPITWMMLDQTEENEPVIFQENSGKIHCPKCRSKIGAFAWSGERCNCGAFVAPSFHIQKAKLDAFTVRGANGK